MRKNISVSSALFESNNWRGLFEKIRKSKVMLFLDINGKDAWKQAMDDLNAAKGIEIVKVTRNQVILRGATYNDPTASVPFNNIVAIEFQKHHRKDALGSVRVRATKVAFSYETTPGPDDL
ncbi:MAG: hypothetical protein Q8Q46_03090 [Candidatus Giovannonibacteria bacterium]|nr:hypothetical protein [Candidatus Giovannonibacteria bacterium]